VAVSAGNLDHYFGADPALALVKTTNGTDNDSAPGPTVLAGSALTWTFRVTNTGNVPLANIAVTDDREGAVCSLAAVAVGQTLDCTKIGIARPGPYVNAGTAATSVDFARADGTIRTVKVSSSNAEHYFGADPRIALVKKTVRFVKEPRDPRQ